MRPSAYVSDRLEHYLVDGKNVPANDPRLIVAQLLSEAHKVGGAASRAGGDRETAISDYLTKAGLPGDAFSKDHALSFDKSKTLNEQIETRARYIDDWAKMLPAGAKSPYEQAPQNLGLSASAASKPTMKGYDQQNPYLAAMDAAIINQVNDNLFRNVMPEVRGGAMAAGQYGSSRQGVVEANALKDANQQLSNAISANRYGDYNNTMNRNLQEYLGDLNYASQQQQMQNALAIANMQNSTQRYGIDANTGLGFAGLANQAGIAGMQNATQRYGINSNTGLGYAGLANQYGIAGMNNATTQRGQDQSYNLGMGNLGLGYFNAQNNYNLGQGTLGLNYLNSNRSYDLGLKSNQLANDQLDYNIDQGNYNRGVTNFGLGLNLMDRMLGYQDQAYQAGSTAQNQPLNYAQTFANMANSAGGMGGTSSQMYQGNPWLGAIGGAQLFGSMFGR